VSAPEVYVQGPDRAGWYVAYERHPIPGGQDMPIVCRKTEEDALKDAREHLQSQGGSVFKAERSVVGA
jgi:hypothetical protein